METIDQLTCDKHPQQLVTNFCAGGRNGRYVENCRMVLCATCICEHTQHHALFGQQPIYQNIKDTFVRVSGMLQQYRKVVMDEKSRAKKIIDMIAERKLSLKSTIEQARSDSIAYISQYFDQVHLEVETALQQEAEKTSLHSEYRLEQLYSELNKQSVELYQLSEELMSYKFGEIVHNLERKYLGPWRERLGKVSKELLDNQIFQPSISYHRELICQFSGTIKKLLRLSFRYPGQRKSKSMYKSGVRVSTPEKPTSLFYRSPSNKANMSISHWQPSHPPKSPSIPTKTASSWGTAATNKSVLSKNSRKIFIN